MKSGVIINPGLPERNNPSGRLYFLDNLRAFVILLVIILHTAISYVTPPFPGWIHNAELNPVFWLIGIPLQSSVLMPAMFFIAGYFVMPSLVKKGGALFMKDKLFRLGIPYAVGVVILAPLLQYMSAVSDGNQATFIERFLAFFKPQYFTQYHFWFLGVLLLFFFIIFILYALFGKKLLPVEGKAGKPSLLLILILFAVTGGARFAIDVFFNSADFASQWTRLYILQFENSGAPLYIAYFLLGIFACRKRWFESGYKTRIFPWALLFIASSIANVFLLVAAFQGNPTDAAGKLIVDFVLSAETLSFLFLLLAIFRRFFNKGRIARGISNSSFSVYLVHLNILFIILFMTRDIAMPLNLKYFLQLITAVAASWVIGYALKKLPALNKIL